MHLGQRKTFAQAINLSPGSQKIAGAIIAASMAVTPAVAQQQDTMVLYDAESTTVRTHLQFGLNAVSEQNLFWDLAAVTAQSADFDADT
jgi:hypothetical protein